MEHLVRIWDWDWGPGYDIPTLVWFGLARFGSTIAILSIFMVLLVFFLFCFLFLGAITSFVRCGSVGWVAGCKSIYLPVVVNNT